MKRLIALVTIFALTAAANAQTLTGSFPKAGGAITITASGGDVIAAGLDFSSASGSLIPAPGTDASPFTFFLANTANQITYGNLGSNVTFADGSSTALSAGATADANDIVAAWGNGPTPVTFSVVSDTVPAGGPIEPCSVSTGVLGSFPRAFCVDSSVGEIGGPVNIGVPPTLVTVPENPDGAPDVDVFVLLETEITAPPTLSYTTTFSWDTPTDPSGLTFREWVGNFNFAPPRAIPLTYVNAPENEIRPGEFSWILDDAGVLATGATVGTGPDTALAGWRSVDGLPEDVPSIERYHFQIAGLPVGTDVTFTKNVVGGQSVPEPTSSAMALIAIGLSGLLRRRSTNARST